MVYKASTGRKPTQIAQSERWPWLARHAENGSAAAVHQEAIAPQPRVVTEATKKRPRKKAE